jgi:hypothetical protein
VISKSFGHWCHYLAAVGDQGEVGRRVTACDMRSKVFGNFMISGPFFKYGGLICANDVAAQCLLNEAEGFRHSVGATHVELRHLGRYPPGMSTKQHKVTMILELAADTDSQWPAFNVKLRKPNP